MLGERWTLLVIRELLLGPKRFRDLQAVMRGLSPTLLSERLHALADAGVVERAESGWALTERGEGLRPTVEALAAWGYDLIDPADPDTIGRGSWLASTACAAAGTVQGDSTVAFDVEGDRFAVRVADGRARARHGVPEAPDGRFDGTLEELYLTLIGERRPADPAVARVARALRLRPAAS